MRKPTDKHDYAPIWKYRKTYPGEETDKYYILKKDDGECTRSVVERQQRRTEWSQTCFHAKPEKQQLAIQHIPEKQWGDISQLAHDTHARNEIPQALEQIRQNSHNPKYNPTIP